MHDRVFWNLQQLVWGEVEALPLHIQHLPLDGYAELLEDSPLKLVEHDGGHEGDLEAVLIDFA